MMRVTPPPPRVLPSPRCQASCWKTPPSICSSAATMRACRSERYSATSAAIGWFAMKASGFARLGRGNGAVADVAAVLHAIEADAVHGLIGAALRHLDGIPERGDAQHAPARGYGLLARQRRAGVEHLAVLGGRRQAADGVALARGVGIAVRGQHHAERGTAVPVGLGRVELAVHGRFD